MPKPRKERRFRAYLWGDRRLGGSAIDRQVADLVDDQQPRHSVDLEPCVEPVLADSPTQRSELKSKVSRLLTKGKRARRVRMVTCLAVLEATSSVSTRSKKSAEGV